LGAGAWGTALAQVAARAGRDVKLWTRSPDLAVGMNARRENVDYLPGVALHKSITPTGDMRDLSNCDAIFSVAPAQHTRATLNRFAPHAKQGVPVVICSKGFERDTVKLMTDVLTEELPTARAAVLSGPSFAVDAGAGLPVAVTLACAEAPLGRALVEAIGQPSFRPYLSDDLVGAAIGGAVKNVLAIVCGVVEGRRLGKSAHAAVLTRGFAEMTRLAVAMGAKPATLTGLSGFGDLVLTCSSPQSRNMSLGFALGQGRKLGQILSERKSVTEGVATAPAVVKLADRHVVNMPICRAIAAVLADKISVSEAIDGLLNRPFTVEMG
jgi:glycerol-3-phosphate dehydrogenase (NAD(P)+)